MMHLDIQQFVAFTLAVLTFIGAGAGFRAGVLRSTAQGWREQAEQRGVELGSVKADLDEMRREVKQVRRDHYALKDDHDRLKDKYIQTLEDSRHDLHLLAEDVRTSLRELKLLISR